MDGFGDWLSSIGGGIKDFASNLFGGGSGGSSVPSFSVSDVSGGESGLTGGVSIPDTSMVDTGGGGGFNIGDFASKVGSGLETGLSGLAGFAKDIAPVAQLGSAGVGIARSIDAMKQAGAQTDLLRKAQERQQATSAKTESSVADPLAQFGQTEISRAQAGQIDPAMQAEIDNWLKAEKMKIMDFFSRSGQGDSTGLRTMLEEAELKAEAMKASVLQSMKTGGVGALSSAGQALSSAGGGATNAASTATAQEQQLEELIAQANRQLAALGTSSS